jgi:hypothetical protein
VTLDHGAEDEIQDLPRWAGTRSAAAKTECDMSRTRLGTPEQPQPAPCQASDTVARLRCMQLHRPAGRWSVAPGLSERQANAVASLLYQWHVSGGPGRTQAAHGWVVAAARLPPVPVGRFTQRDSIALYRCTWRDLAFGTDSDQLEARVAVLTHQLRFMPLPRRASTGPQESRA